VATDLIERTRFWAVDDLVPEELWALVKPLLPAPPRPPAAGIASSLIATASPRSCSWPAPPPHGGCYLPVLDRLMPVDNLTWFVNDPGRDGSRR
jgi:hypothetical protein